MTDVPHPRDPDYLDENSTRIELSRSFDVCNGCRQCIERCGVFPTLFNMLEGREGAGDLAPIEQDEVIASCYHCGLCATACPYSASAECRVEDVAPIDIPRLMLRATAMNVAAGHKSSSRKRATRTLGAAARLGALGVRFDNAANRIVTAEPGSLTRRVTERLTGVSSVRTLAPYARERFSTWFRRRSSLALGKRQGHVSVYPTCLVEYHEVGIGKDLVAVYERNGVECGLSSAGCCGAPWLHGGALRQFHDIADRNVQLLAAEIADGAELIVPQAACAAVLRRAYPEHVSPQHRGDANCVAAQVRDPAEYLLEVHQGGETRLDTNFVGELPRSITYHAVCHQRGGGQRYAGRELLRLVGVRVDLVLQCAGAGDTWGMHSDHAAAAAAAGEQLADRLDHLGANVVVSECHRAGLAIEEHSAADANRTVAHPIQVLARAYGISDRL